MSRIIFPLSDETLLFVIFSLIFPKFLLTECSANGITSIGNGKVPRISTCFESSTIHINFFEAAASIFSLVCAPPPPLIR